MSSQMRCLLLAALMGYTCLIADGLTSAQEKGAPLDEAKQRQQAEIQRVEAELNKVRDEVRSLAVKDPVKAVVLLSEFRDKLTANKDIPDGNRKQMLRSVEVWIAAYTGRTADLPAKPKKTRPGEQDQEPPPDIGDLRYFSGPPPASDNIKLPPDWKAKFAKRMGNSLTKQERKLMDALATPMTIDLKDSTLEAVIDYLKNKSGVTIIVPQSVLDEKMITNKISVSVNLKKVTMRTILKKALSDVGLVYIIKDNVIQVTTEERAKQTLTTRTHYLGDLLLLTDVRLPSYAQQAQAIQTINEVINVITSTIEPNSWWINDGPGRIVFNPRSVSLVVTATAEVHLMLAPRSAKGATTEKGDSTDPRTKTGEKFLSTRQLHDALESPLSIEMENSTLEEVLKYLKEKTGVSIVVEQVLLDEKVIKPKAPVSITMKVVSVRTILRKLMSLLTEEELDYALRPPTIVITRPHLAAHVAEYEVRDLIEQMPRLLPQLTSEKKELRHDLSPTDGVGLLVRGLLDAVNLRPWETVEVRNHSRLVVFANPSRQEDIGSYLVRLHRLVDVAVVMNARLYEVDRAFFIKHVVPLLNKKDIDKGPILAPIPGTPFELLAQREPASPTVIPIEAPLLKALGQEKLLVESDQVRLRPSQEATFLSKQNVFRYAIRPDPLDKESTLTRSDLAGVSFAVRPILSSDLRYLRLQISQQAVQLVGIQKTTRFDLATGKDVEVEVPAVRKTTATGTVQIPDTGPILLPVDYRPPGKDGKDKVWLLVARPYIWIKKEEEKRGKPILQADIWDSEVPQDESPAPENRLPSDDKTTAILQAVLKDVLTNPKLKDARDFYGTAKDKTFTLIDGNDGLGWPKKFHPETPGFKLVQVKLAPFVDQHRVLGIRVDKFDLKQKKSDADDSIIEVCLFNAGGSANGGAGGAGRVTYNIKHVHNRWSVVYGGYESQ